jgi:hypothetical protein
MSEAIKPTPGHWILDDADPDDAYRYVVHGDGDTFGCICRISTNGNANPEDDARLIAEAGTVHHETGLTPRQLVERVKELEEALQGLASALSPEIHGSPNSPLEIARAALSKSIHNTVAEVKL